MDQLAQPDARPASLTATTHAVNAIAATVRAAVDIPTLSLLPSACPTPVYNFLRDRCGLRTRP